MHRKLRAYEKTQLWKVWAIPVVAAALLGFWGGAEVTERLMQYLGHDAKSARLNSLFLGGMAGGLACGILVFIPIFRSFVKVHGR